MAFPYQVPPKLPRRSAQTALALVLVAALAGCATSSPKSAKTSPDKAEPKVSAEAAAAKEAELKSLIAEDPLAAAAYWGSIYDQNPKDANAAASYGDALRQMGSVDKALTILRPAAELAPEDPHVLAAYGKALGANGQGEDAVPVLDHAAALDPKNPQTLSAAGVAQDQAGNHKAAHDHYEAALKLKPDDPNILNNYGLSCAFNGDLPKAEALLRRAVSVPGTSSQTRQNLSLVLALAGKFDEAQKIAGRDLRPQEAENNIDYIRALMGQPVRWNDASAPKTPKAEAQGPDPEMDLPGSGAPVR